LQRLYTALRDTRVDAVAGVEADYETRFQVAMNDDFNTPEALAVLFDLALALNRAREQDSNDVARLANTLLQLANRLGILQADPASYLRGQRDAGALGGPSDADIEALIARREQARTDRDWGEADRIRDELTGLGIVLEDGGGGTRWRRE
jgi:cysteinyl-tRNA synthetase